MSVAAPELTTLIRASASGDTVARAALYERAYPELHRLAQSRLFRHGGDAHLAATEILSEGYMRFVNMGEMLAQDRASFFALASNIMRSVIFDTVRKAQTEKRGGDCDITVLSTAISERVGIEDSRFLDVEHAMQQLDAIDARLAQVVDMHFFGGLTFEEIADALSLNIRTIRRDWQKAQLLLQTFLK